jgi:hypothetical protein
MDEEERLHALATQRLQAIEETQRLQAGSQA